MPGEETDLLKDFVVVMRGPSSVVFKQNEGIPIENFPSAIGPVNIIYTSRWIKKGKDIIHPGHLWIEVRGKGKNLDEVLIPFANASVIIIPLLSLVANAAIGEPDIEIGYDITPGVQERDYFQHYMPNESGLYSYRIMTKEMLDATIELLKVIEVHPDHQRMLRAFGQYDMALESWRMDRSIMSLAHLWMALEALTKVRIRSELVRRSLGDEKDLAGELGIDIKDLDSTIRKNVILRNDEQCYKESKKASDGYEHGFLGYDEIHNTAKNMRYRMAKYIRDEILYLSGLSAETIKLLNESPLDKLLGYWPVRTNLQGKLIGMGDNLAAPGNEYPFIQWQQIVSNAQIKDRIIDYEIENQFYNQLANGINFQLEKLEAWQPD